MAAQRPIVVDSGTVPRKVVHGKQSRKHPGKPVAASPPATAREAELNPAEGGASGEAIAAFDPHVFLTKFAVGKNSREYQGDESIFLQGDAADAVFYIQSGKVKLTAVSAQGKEAVVAILPEASFFGEGCLAGQPLRMATAKAVQRAAVIRVTKQAMITLLHQQAEFAERFLAYLLSRNIRMEADLVDHLFNSSEKRLARLLLLMANFGQESKPIPLIAKISQETLADMIGTTRSRVSFFLNRFRDLGFINYDGGGMHVHSSLVSVVLHD
jgi:CRP-like cAMP-binding protein